MSPKDVAKILKVSLHTVKTWRDAGCPWRKLGRNIDMHPSEVEAWLIRTGRAHRGASAENRSYDTKVGLELEDAKLKAEERRLRIAKAKGELLPVKQTVTAIEDVVSQASAHLDELPDLVCSKLNLSGDTYLEARQTCQAVIRTCRTHLRSLLAEVLCDPSSHNGKGTAPLSKRGRKPGPSRKRSR